MPTTYTSLWVSTEVIDNTQTLEYTQTQIMVSGGCRVVLNLFDLIVSVDRLYDSDSGKSFVVNFYLFS